MYGRSTASTLGCQGRLRLCLVPLHASKHSGQPMPVLHRQQRLDGGLLRFRLSAYTRELPLDQGEPPYRRALRRLLLLLCRGHRRRYSAAGKPGRRHDHVHRPPRSESRAHRPLLGGWSPPPKHPKRSFRPRIPRDVRVRLGRVKCSGGWSALLQIRDSVCERFTLRGLTAEEGSNSGHQKARRAQSETLNHRNTTSPNSRPRMRGCDPQIVDRRHPPLVAARQLLADPLRFVIAVGALSRGSTPIVALPHKLCDGLMEQLARVLESILVTAVDQ